MTGPGQAAGNVHVVGVDGSSDDLDRPLEAVFGDAAFKDRHRLGSVNSVNARETQASKHPNHPAI